MNKLPYTTKPEDITRILQKIVSVEVPSGKVNADFFKSLGFTAKSSGYLFDIFKKLGFINEDNEPSETWAEYVANDRRGLVLASAIKGAYENLFALTFCPYLEGDETVVDIIRRDEPEASNREIDLLVETFRSLSELADFQDIIGEEERNQPGPAASTKEVKADVRVNPNLQLNIQIHIDPATSEEKIETIFKNMQKYLLGKEPG